MKHTLSKKELKCHLDLLSDKLDGKRTIVNLYRCYKHKYIRDKKAIRSFLMKWISLGAKDSLSAWNNFYKVREIDKTFFAMMCINPSLDGITDSSIVTVMDTQTFCRYLVNPKYTNKDKKLIKKMVLDDVPKSHRKEDEDNYCQMLKEIMSKPDWYRPDGTLGQEKAGVCIKPVWYTNIVDLYRASTAEPAHNSRATKARDILGLIHSPKSGNEYLLTIQLPMKYLRNITKLIIARPGFAEGEGKRFAVYLDKQAESIYNKKWGVTVNLRKLSEDSAREIRGVPERICSALPLAEIGEFIGPDEVEPLGWVNDIRGKTTDIDDDTAFIDQLQNGITIDEMNTELLGIANTLWEMILNKTTQ